MSMELMAKAMKVKVGNPLRKLVLLKLADNANDMGECWPSYQHIADQCEIARSTVKSHIRELEKVGLLTREFRKEGDLNKSNVFHLTLDRAINTPVNTTKDGGAVSDPVGQDAPEGGAADNPPGAADNLGGGAADNPRTYHSFEPINEPVIEPKNKRKQKAVFALPEGLNLDAWALWVEYRKQSKLKAYAPTPMSAGVQAGKLISLATGDLALQMAVVKQAIDGGWSGLYPLKKTGSGAESKIIQAQRAAEQAIADGRVGYDYDTPFGQR